MEDHNVNQRENTGAGEIDQKKYARKRRRKFFFVILLIIFVNIVFIFGFARYERYRGEKSVEKTAQALRDWEKESYDAAMANTYGGKTPQETLRLYIDAVEKGDYKLASRYFIGDYQDMELKNLQKSSKAKLNTYLSLLKDSSKITGGYYSRDYMPGGKEFIVDNPIYIRMKLYPNGIWKIIEI